jgi:hypothetical protein
MKRSFFLAFVSVMCWTFAVCQLSHQEKVPVVIKVPRLPDLDVDIIVRDSIPFLPAREVFEYIGLRAHIDTVQMVLKGFFRNPDSTYTIDIRNRVAQTKTSSLSVTEKDVVIQKDSIYLRAGFLKDFFGVDFRYNPRKLLVSLYSAPSMLPAVSYGALQRLLQVQERGGGFTIPVPDYVIPRSTTISGIGRFNYDIFHRFLKANNFTIYSFILDSKLLGGDLDLTARGTASSRVSQNPVVRGYYRYPFPENSFLQQIIIGHGVTTGIFPLDVFGVEFTNRPLANRIILSREPYKLRSLPNSYVAFSGSGSGMQYASTDTLGNYFFEAPLRYGLNTLAFNTKDKYGEFNIDRYLIDIPQSMIPAGIAEYSVFLGKQTSVDNTYVSGNHLSYGVSSRLTVGGVFDYYSLPGLSQKWHAALTSTARIFNSVTASGLVAPSGSSQIVLSWLPQIASDISVTRAWDARNDPYNFGGLSDSWGALANLSVLPENVLRLSVDARQLNYYADYRDYQYGGSLSGTFGNVFPRIGTRIVQRKSSTNTFTVSNLTDFSLSAVMPQQVIFRTNASYDNLAKDFFSLEAEVSKLFFRRLYLNFVYDHFPTIPITIVTLNVRYIFPFLEVKTTASHSTNSAMSYTARLTGSTDFNFTKPSFMFNYFRARNVLGGYSLHPFIDENNNNVRDPGEQLVDTGRIYIQNTSLGFAPISIAKNMFTNSRISPYQNYSVFLDPQTLADPLLVPKYYSIGFMTESNVTKDVDVPLVYGGTIRGTVVDDANLPQEGIPLILTPIITGSRDVSAYAKKIVTFSTGEFEFNLVRPGRYRIEIDFSQATSSGLLSLPASREVTIVSRPGGDVSENQNFQLKKH